MVLDQNRLTYGVEGVALTIVSGLGIVGTLMSLVILLKPKPRSDSRNYFNTFLTALAVFDSLLMVNAVLIFGIPRLYVK